MTDESTNQDPQHLGDGTKSCKFCAEEIKQAAVICRFCGRSQSETSSNQSKLDDLADAIQNKNFTMAIGLLPLQKQVVYQAEVDRRKRSTGIAYLFYFLLGLLGAYKFYSKDQSQ